MGFGVLGFLLEGDDIVLVVKLHHPECMRVLDQVAEHRGPFPVFDPFDRTFQYAGKSLP